MFSPKEEIVFLLDVNFRFLEIAHAGELWGADSPVNFESFTEN